MRILLLAISIGLCAPLVISCGTKSAPADQPDFTRADSLTDKYLSLHDSIHQLWNVMINDDNKKIESMHHLLHELLVSQPDAGLKPLEARIDQLMRMRYTQRSMFNHDVVNEYDLATDALLSELVAHAESRREFSYNKTLQKLVTDIVETNNRLQQHRFDYDSVVWAYNRFIDAHSESLLRTDATLKLEKKASFRATSVE